MDHFPTRWSDPGQVSEGSSDHENVVRQLVESIALTINSSGEDYDRALREFFTQIEALGLLIGAREIDEISSFLRQSCRQG